MPKQNNKTKVLIALSGGVDSSVAAALLVKQGYDVTAAYMVNYDDTKESLLGRGGPSQGRGGSESDIQDNIDPSPLVRTRAPSPRRDLAPCWVPDYRDAVRVAAHLHIPIIKLDFTKEYREKVLDYMFAEYNSGRTPNPDVMCNKYVKFGVWLDYARKFGFDYLATGHYARVKKLAISNKQLTNRLLVAHCSLLISKDSNKDQTYFLHQLNQEQLTQTMFPIGEYTKPEVRKLAAKFKLPTADKEESMGICFIGEVPMKEFLEQRIPPRKGRIVLADGTVVGEHDGLAFYTIGQRHIGLGRGGASHHPLEGVAAGGVRTSAPQSTTQRNVNSMSPTAHTPLPDLVGKTPSQGVDAKPTPTKKAAEERGGGDMQPLYVIDKNLEKNELIVGYENDPALYKKEIVVTDVNWINPPSLSLRRGKGGQEPQFPLKCEVRLRHREPLKKCVVSQSPLGRGRGGLGSINVTFAKPERAVTPGQFAVFYKNGECLGGGTIA